MKIDKTEKEFRKELSNDGMGLTDYSASGLIAALNLEFKPEEPELPAAPPVHPGDYFVQVGTGEHFYVSGRDASEIKGVTYGPYLLVYQP